MTRTLAKRPAIVDAEFIEEPAPPRPSTRPRRVTLDVKPTDAAASASTTASPLLLVGAGVVGGAVGVGLGALLRKRKPKKRKRTAAKKRRKKNPARRSVLEHVHEHRELVILIVQDEDVAVECDCAECVAAREDELDDDLCDCAFCTEERDR